MRIEHLDEKSLTACARLFVEVFNSPPWNESWELPTAQLRFSEFFHSAGFYGLVAYEADEFIGFVLGNAEQWDKARHFNLREMCVATSSQRSGVGTGLILALESLLAERGIERIYLLTARDSSAHAFYEKCGFYLSPKMVMMAKRGPFH